MPKQVTLNSSLNEVGFNDLGNRQRVNFWFICFVIWSESTLPRSSTREREKEKIEKRNRFSVSNVGKEINCPTIPLYEKMKNYSNDSDLLSDGLHFGTRGNSILADLIEKFIKDKNLKVKTQLPDWKDLSWIYFIYHDSLVNLIGACCIRFKKLFDSQNPRNLIPNHWPLKRSRTINCY